MGQKLVELQGYKAESSLIVEYFNTPSDRYAQIQQAEKQ